MIKHSFFRLKATFIILALILLLSCENKEASIYQLKKFSKSEKIDQKFFIQEVFIIANPPSDNEQLMGLVKSFNDTTLTRDLIDKRLIDRKRVFYKETKDLNENFEEKDPDASGYFEKVDLSGYYSDKLVESSWGKGARFAGHYTSYLDEKTGTTTHFVFDLP